MTKTPSWGELTDSEKIERLRDKVRSQAREIEEIKRHISWLDCHSHADGRVTGHYNDTGWLHYQKPKSDEDFL